MTPQKILLNGNWTVANFNETFTAENPASKTSLTEAYPISIWADIDAALDAATAAFSKLQSTPRETIAKFLENYADRIDARSAEICALANQETALPVEPRLASGELPRTTNQLRLAAASCRSSAWTNPVIDSKINLRSCHAAIGPVAVFGPNNFPLAYNGISGGDFASAIAAGNPVIAKAHPLHPGTTRLLAEEALAALNETGMPAGTVQLIYAMDYTDGEKLAHDHRLAAIGYTGGRQSGLKLKSAADAAGKPIFLELSSINPVVMLPQAIEQRGDEIVEELKGSCLMGCGQFCTSPGLIVMVDSPATKKFISTLVDKFNAAPVGTLLAKSGQAGLAAGVEKLKKAGAELLCGGTEGGGSGYSYANTILKTGGTHFLKNSETLQTEAFGNATLIVVAESVDQVVSIMHTLEGNLTGCIYSATDGTDDATYDRVAPVLRQLVGRMLNDKMPTGVAVSPAMNHGGPYPSTGHPIFTAVGFPASIVRFSMLQCFDNVREHRLPAILRDKNPTGVMRLVDGVLTIGDVTIQA